MHALIREKHMACAWQMKCFPQPDRGMEAAEALMRKAFEVVTAVENKLTEFKPSPFNRINEQAGVSPVAVDEEIWAIVQRAIAFGHQTNGIFNIAFATLLRSQTPDDPALQSLADFRKVELNETDKTIYLPDRRMRISLPDAPRPWRMGIQNPFEPQKQIGMVQMRHNALASSGNYIKKGHILSKSQEVMAATVQGDTCECCDMWGTYLMCLPVQEALNELNRGKLFGILVDSQAGVHFSHAARTNTNSDGKPGLEHPSAAEKGLPDNGGYST